MVGVQQSFTQCNADGRANTLAVCASITTICCPDASELGFDAPLALKTACVLGNATLKEITTRERLSLQVNETELSVLPLSALFLASLRFCVHYCIDRDTVHKKKTALRAVFCCDVHNKLEDDLETNNKQINHKQINKCT